MNFDGYELQIFISVLGILASAFLALLVDYLKSTNEKLRESNAQLLAKHDSLAERASGDTSKILGVLSEQTVALKKVIEQPVRLVPAGMDYREGIGHRDTYGQRDPFGRIRPYGPVRPPAPLVVREIPAPRREAVQEVASSADRVKILPEEKVVAALESGGTPEAKAEPSSVAAQSLMSQPAGAVDAKGSEDALPPNVVRIRLTPDSSRGKVDAQRVVEARLAAEDLEDGQRLEDIVIADEVPVAAVAAMEEAPLPEVLPEVQAVFVEAPAEPMPVLEAFSTSSVEPAATESVSESVVESEVPVEAPVVAAPLGEFDRFMEEMVEEFDTHPERYELPEVAEAAEVAVADAPVAEIPVVEMPAVEIPAVEELAAVAELPLAVEPVVSVEPLVSVEPVVSAEPIEATPSFHAQELNVQEAEPSVHWSQQGSWADKAHWAEAPYTADPSLNAVPREAQFQQAQYVEPAYVQPAYVESSEFVARKSEPALVPDFTGLGVTESPAVADVAAPEVPSQAAEEEELPAPSHAVEEIVPMLDVPPGTYPMEALAELLERREALTGLVVAIGINEFAQIHENLGRNAADQLLSSVDQLMSSLAGREGFCTRHQADEFVLIFPKLNGPAAQRSLSELSERLWDFQLRNLGTFSVVFSWGAMEAQRESLRDAMGVAQERMKETQASRRTVSMTGGRRRRVS